MSNIVVGNIYAQIIDKVIQASQNDFEESGIDQATLAELKDRWQQRLSAYRLAQFPWDPAPVATTVQQTPTLPSNVIPKQEAPDGDGALSSQPAQLAANGVRVKTEPGYENTTPSYPPNGGYQTGPAGLNPHLAQQRAQALLQQQQGFSRQQPPTHIQMPGQGQQQRPYPGQVQQQRPPVNPTQTDGSGDDDWNIVLSARRAIDDNDRLAADDAMHAQIQRMTHQLDGGLMVPLSDQPRAPRKRKVPAGANATVLAGTAGPAALPSTSQLDGTLDEDDDEDKLFKAEDEDEKDEDAINSDLDDSDEEQQQAEDDEEDGSAVAEAILCTYDKVQRVKNKWKCTLKDGVLSTKGKDYLFHKAQGEFEW